jgi:hypothetical protein
MKEYPKAAPEHVKARWLQYTAETDNESLLSDVKAAETVAEAIASLDRVDRAIAEAFDVSERQEQTDDAEEACAWALQRMQRELEKRASTVLTSTDV